MRRLLRLSMAVVTVSFVLAILAGCGGGPKYVPVKGRLVDNGQPVKPSAKLPPGATRLPPGDPGMKMEFITVKDGKAGESFGAAMNPSDATFTVPGPKDKGLAPGKYKVSIHVGASGSPDALMGAFTADRTPLVVDIPDKAQANVTVDVGKKTVTVE